MPALPSTPPDPYLEMYAHPTEGPSNSRLFELVKHRDWIKRNVIEFPINSRLFTEESIRDNTLEIYHAEKEDALRVQSLKFHGSGRFVFRDCIWKTLPGWQGGFYPQAMGSVLLKTGGFGQRYFKDCLGYVDETFFRVEIGGIVGHERRVQNAGIRPVRKFIFDREIAAGEHFNAGNGSPEDLAAKFYNEIMIESELDPAIWGYGKG